MARQVVENDDITGPQGWDEDLFDVSEEARPVDGSVEDSGRREPGRAQRADEGCCLPMAVRHGCDQALSERSPTIAASHVGCCQVSSMKTSFSMSRLPWV